MGKTEDIQNGKFNKGHEPGLEDILKDRGNNYGKFDDNANMAMGVCSTLQVGFLNKRERYATTMIAAKLARIASNPSGDHKDSWRDIAGYAKLAEDCGND